MACETMRTSRNQTISERAEEIRRITEALSAALAAGTVKAMVGRQGAVAFQGWADKDRGGITDACAYRRIMAKGSALARQAIARAEQLAGRSVDRRVVAQGLHSHDGVTWHEKH